VVIGSEYTIELVFRFDRLDGFAKIVDFNNATEDCGLYSLDGRMDFWPIATGLGAALEADSYAHVVLTRDATDTVVAYVNGARQLSFHDTDDIAVIDANNTLRLFSDDTVTPNEDSGGAVSRIRLYDGPLTASEVAALAAELPIISPTLADGEPFLREQATADRFSGAVLVTKHGEVLFSQAVGLADRDRAIPNTLQTRFRIGSMNKMITAVAILQLVEADKIELTAPVGDYLTDYPNADVATTVTIHHLLTHTGGTGDIFGPTFDANRDELRTHHDYVELYGPRGPEFDPGTRWAYSNYGYVLLGAIIEAVTGQTYYDYVDDHIYQPAGMTATGSLPETEAVPDRSIGYTTPTPGGEWNPNTDTLPYRGTAAGGGYSTVEDLTRFAEALLNHRLLSAGSTDLLFAAKVDSGPGTGYAYGFEDQRDVDGSGPVGHGGAAPVMNGDLRIYPNSGHVVAVLANLDPPAAQRISSYLHPRLPPP
jgi:CubicO group peptidase (beta-lactamase class C family)